MRREQLGGGRGIDARPYGSSRGGGRYEMRVGERPWVGLAGGTARGGAPLRTVLRAQRVSHGSERLLEETIARALAAEPDDRFASVAEFAAGLREAVRRRWLPRLRLPRVGWRSALLGGATA